VHIEAGVLGRLRHLGQDFELEVAQADDGPAYRLGVCQGSR
jgi:hypothetical protein